MDIGQTWVRVNGRSVITLVVFGDEGVEPLLGDYTLEGLRLAVDPVRRRLIPVPGRLMAVFSGSDIRMKAALELTGAHVGPSYSREEGTDAGEPTSRANV